MENTEGTRSHYCLGYVSPLYTASSIALAAHSRYLVSSPSRCVYSCIPCALNITTGKKDAGIEVLTNGTVLTPHRQRVTDFFNL